MEWGSVIVGLGALSTLTWEYSIIIIFIIMDKPPPSPLFEPDNTYILLHYCCGDSRPWVGE